MLLFCHLNDYLNTGEQNVGFSRWGKLSYQWSYLGRFGVTKLPFFVNY